jgi:hypothetical protein
MLGSPPGGFNTFDCCRRKGSVCLVVSAGLNQADIEKNSFIAYKPVHAAIQVAPVIAGKRRIAKMAKLGILGL